MLSFSAGLAMSASSAHTNPHFVIGAQKKHCGISWVVVGQPQFLRQEELHLIKDLVVGGLQALDASG